jgi:hypothetical protein
MTNANTGRNTPKDGTVLYAIEARSRRLGPGIY